MDVKTQKIDSNQLEIFGKVVTSFLVDDKDKKLCFLKETFLLANISIDVAFEMFFIILSND